MGTSGFSVLKNSITISFSRVFMIWSLVLTLSVITSCSDVKSRKVEERTTLAIAEEAKSNLIPGQGRFHITTGNRILVIYFISGTDPAGNKIAENRIVEIFRGGIAGKEVVLPLKNPFSNFFTATVRAGSQPSDLIDILGTPDGINNSIRYARILIR